MIKFKKLYGQGFGSLIHETEFKLDRLGLNIIIAKNGSGKTTIFNLLNWTLYGSVLKDIKDISTWDRFRPDDWKGTLGRVKFEKDGIKYEIIRCKGYKGKVLESKGGDRLVLKCNDLDISERNKKDTQLKINNLLGYTSDLFKNSILFGQKLRRLSQESGPEKKKVFEEAFESKFIKDSRDKGLIILEQKQSEFNEVDLHIVKVRIQKDAAKKSFNELNAEKKRQRKEKDKEIKDLKSKYDRVDKAINEYSRAELMTKLRQLSKAQTELQSLSNLAQEIKDLENRELREIGLGDDINDLISTQKILMMGCKMDLTQLIEKCPRCNQKLSPDKIKNEKAKIKEKFNGAKKEIEKLQVKLEDQNIIRNDLLGKISSKKKDKEKIISLVTMIRILEMEIKSLTYKDDNYKGAKLEKVEIEKRLASLIHQKSGLKLKPFKDQIIAHKQEIQKVKPRWKELKKDIKNLKWAIDDVLGNKGLKAYIFDTMLKQLNELLKYYEQFIGYRIEFNVDFDSANKDIYTLCYIGKHPCFYEELSGAQSQLVDIATAFALNDLVTRGRPINIMIFDEVMDNLDEENEDIVYDLITNKSLTTSLFLITHNLDLQNSSTKVIRMGYNKHTGETLMKLL